MEAVIRVFLASPSDVNSVRAEVKEALNKLNNDILALPVLVRAFDWSDVPPDYGRPQDLINKYLDECDIFVGILWRRWGTPTGGFTSGFEEEFERVRRRREAEGVPKIWLFFREPSIKDPSCLPEEEQGQLERVMEFRREIESSQALFYQSFRRPAELKERLRTLVIGHILCQNGPAIPQPIRSVTHAFPHRGVAVAGHMADMGKVADPNDQLTELLAILNDAVRENRAPEQFQAARLYLLASTWMSQVFTGELLGVHEINLLYRYRNRVVLTLDEIYLLFRTVLGDSFGLKPGWYWVRGIPYDRLALGLKPVAEHDPDPVVSGRAAEIAVALEQGTDRDWLNRMLTSGSTDAREKILDFLAGHGTPDHLAAVERALTGDNPRVRERVLVARLSILARCDSVSAWNELLSSPIKDKQGILNQLQRNIAALSTGYLQPALSHTDDSLRAFAVRELARRNALSDEALLDLLKDPSLKVVQEACAGLARRSREKPLGKDHVFEAAKRLDRHGIWLVLLPELRRTAVLLYRTLPLDELQLRAKWMAPDGDIAYEAMALQYFTEVGDRIRNDLATDFRSLEDEWRSQLEQDLNLLRLLASVQTLRPFADKKILAMKEEIQKLSDKIPEINEFKRKQFARAALTALAENGGPEDVELGRRWLTAADRDVRLAAVRVVGRFGNRDDAGILASIAKNEQGEIKRAAAEAALALASGDDRVADFFLRSEDPDLVRPAIRYLARRQPARLSERLEPLLASEVREVRLLATAALAAWWGGADESKRLEEILAAYLDRPSYYYDVVCWLDGFLYAPLPAQRPEFQEAFGSMRELLSESES